MSRQHFNGLKFHRSYFGTKRACVTFPNGYSASVVCGGIAKSNGVNTYELGVLLNGCLTYTTPITDDVLGHLTKEEVEAVLIKIEALPPHE